MFHALLEQGPSPHPERGQVQPNLEVIIMCTSLVVCEPVQYVQCFSLVHCLWLHKINQYDWNLDLFIWEDPYLKWCAHLTSCHHSGTNPRFFHCFVDEDAMSWTKSFSIWHRYGTYELYCHRVLYHTCAVTVIIVLRHARMAVRYMNLLRHVLQSSCQQTCYVDYAVWTFEAGLQGCLNTKLLPVWDVANFQDLGHQIENQKAAWTGYGSEL